MASTELKVLEQEGDKLPLTALLCKWAVGVQLFAAVVCVGHFGIGPIYENPDQREIDRFMKVRNMLGPTLWLECAQLLSSLSDVNRMYNIAAVSIEMSMAVVMVYLLNIGYYYSMSELNGGLVHVNLRALDFGSFRPIYAPRWVGWCIAVPVLVVVNNFPFTDCLPVHRFLARLLPQLLCTAGYCAMAWLGAILGNSVAGWLLIGLSFVTYVLVLADQANFLVEMRGKSRFFGYKAGLVVLKEVFFLAYGIVFMLGNLDLASSLTVQTFFSFGDVYLKAGVASCLVIFRNWHQIQDLDSTVRTGQEDMSRFIQEASVPILALSSSGMVTAWNERLMRLSRIPESVALGSSILDLLEPSSREICAESLQVCLTASSRCSRAIELTFVHPSECMPEKSIMDAALKKTTNSKGAQLLVNFVLQNGSSEGGVLCVGQDLTELLSLKAVQERKSRFTAIVSHELRSPLHGITGLTNALADVVEDEGHRRQLNMINGCARRLLDLVTNIMDMAQLENVRDEPQSPMALNEVNLMAVVDEVVWMTKMAVDKAGKQLLNDQVKLINEMVEGKLPVILGDAYKCSQLFYNLITNACKFTASGSVTIRARHDQADSCVEIDVIDTGKGIEPNALEHIFLPFEQENDQDTRSFQGIGLGLSVALGIAKLHNGEIRVQSKVGEGSTFTVRLPCLNSKLEGLEQQAHSMPSPRERNPTSSSSSWNKASSKMKADPSKKPAVLCVDTNETNQQIIDAVLGRTFRVIKLKTLQQAVDFTKVPGEVLKAVLLNILQPGPAGFEEMVKFCNSCPEGPTMVVVPAAPPGPARPLSADELLRELQLVSVGAGHELAGTLAASEAARKKAEAAIDAFGQRLKAADQRAHEAEKKVSAVENSLKERLAAETAKAAAAEERAKQAEQRAQAAEAKAKAAQAESLKLPVRGKGGSGPPADMEEVQWLRSELEMFAETVETLRQQVNRWRQEAWNQKAKAEALARKPSPMMQGFAGGQYPGMRGTMQRGHSSGPFRMPPGAHRPGSQLPLQDWDAGAMSLRSWSGGPSGEVPWGHSPRGSEARRIMPGTPTGYSEHR